MSEKVQVSLRWGPALLDTSVNVLEVQTLDGASVSIVGVTLEDLRRWQGGEFIQDVFPQLSPDEREVLISGISSRGFDDMFGDDGDDDG